MDTWLIIVTILGVVIFASPLKRIVIHCDRLVEANTNHEQVKWEEMGKRDIDKLLALGGSPDESFQNKLSAMLNKRK